MRKNTTISTLIKVSFLLILMAVSKLGMSQACDPKWNKVKSSPCENSPIQFEANSPGRTTYEWDFGDGTSVGPGAGFRDPVHAYTKAGLYTVTFKGSGGAGPCSDTVMVLIKESPTVKVTALYNKEQCFLGNKFCFIDSTRAAQKPVASKILSIRYLFSDGALYTINDPKGGDTICHTVIDPNGGYFDLTIEAEDYNGCVTKIKYDKFIRVFPKLGVSFKSSGPNACIRSIATITNTTDTFTKLKDIAFFKWDFGNPGSANNIIVGDSVTNTDWWRGPTGNGVMKHTYDVSGKKSGTYVFNGKLTVTTRYGCTETFTFNGSATISILSPRIVADPDSSCSKEAITKFSLADGPIQNAKILWNFGDPPSGPDNFEDKDWNPSHGYGLGPWMISLRIRQGPCDTTVFDTITKIGPTSTIEIPFDRVKEDEKYQCIIKDSVHFVNHSTFYHTDPYPVFEDSSAVIRYYTLLSDTKVGYWEMPLKIDTIRPYGSYKGKATLITRFYLEKDTLESFPQSVNAIDSIIYFVNGKKIKRQVNNPIVSGNDILVIRKQKEYAFKWPGDQTAIDSKFPKNKERRKDHVLRLWSFGDNYAPKCTTDTKKNKNVGLNCNFSFDSLPVHWYTPWEEIYKFYGNSQFYKTPAEKTVLCKGGRFCYKVKYYPKDSFDILADTLVILPKNATYTYGGKTITPSTPEIFTGSYRIKKVASPIVGPGTYVPTMSDEKWTFTTKTAVEIKNIKTGVYSAYASGTYTLKNMASQFILKKGDSAILAPQVIITPGSRIKAQPTIICVDTIIGGRDTFIQRSRIFVDSNYHRLTFYKNNAQCNTVALYHEDTVHSMRCNSTDQISLALTPPSAVGLEFEGIRCYAPPKHYGMIFDVGKTKPGCSQRWLQFNFDSAAGKNNWTTQPAFKPNPLPGVGPWHLGYQLQGAYPTKFVMPYGAGSLTSKNPGWVTVGVIIGNGKMINGVPQCIDTMWYHNAFRYLFLDAAFEIIQPEIEQKRVCVGDTFTFKLNDPLMDSITQLTWTWNDDEGTYYEENSFYYQPYKGPSPTRNDNVIKDWKKTDKWLYNYVIRVNYDGFSFQTIDTIVTAVIRKWNIVPDVSKAGDALKTAFNSLGLDMNKIPSDEIGMYFGSGGTGCIDTTGLGDLITFAVAPYRDALTFARHTYDDVLVRTKSGKDSIYSDDWYRYTDYTKTDSTIISQSLHWRAKSQAGFDTLRHRVKTASKVCPYGDSTIKSKKLTYRDSLIIKSKYPPYNDTIIKSKVGYYGDSLRANKLTGKQMNPGVFRHVYTKRGRYSPTFQLRNTEGCFQPRNKEVNVGFYWNWTFSDSIICHGTNIVLRDSIRYYAYEDPFNWLNSYPYWKDANRYKNRRETMKIDFDEDDDSTIKSSVAPYCDSIQLRQFGTTGIGIPLFSWHYDEPGIYKIRIAMKDSLGCVDTARQKIYVSGVKAGFKLSAGSLSCKNIISFFDTSLVIDSCLSAKGKPCDKIIEYTWDFGDGKQKSKLQHPSHDFTQNGYFTVRLKVKTQLGCEDSASMVLFIAGPRPYFNPISDTVICVGDSVIFDNLSLDPLYNPVWEWNFGDGQVGSDTARRPIGHRYNKPGTFEVYLTQFDNVNGTSIRCSAIYPDTSSEVIQKVKRIIRVKPVAPANFTIAPRDVICPNELVNFKTESDPIYTRFSWQFGTGDTLNTTDTNTVKYSKYSKVGKYTVIMIPDYDTPEFHKCLDTVKKVVEVMDVKADFTSDTTKKPIFCFTNTSVGAVKYEWIMDGAGEFVDGTSNTDENPCFKWQDTGCHKVTLIATNAIGCTDTTEDYVCSTFVAVFIPYNVFTPEPKDGFNDVFRVKAEGLVKYDIVIYNRWGEVVYKSTDPTQGWNGKVKNDGAECPEGTYFYLINYQIQEKQLNDGKNSGKPISGTVTLIRGK